jgi:hypothetical protein
MNAVTTSASERAEHGLFTAGRTDMLTRVLLMATALAWLVDPAVLVADEPAARPNVLLICVDDLKPLLGCYGDAVEVAAYRPAGGAGRAV